MEERVRTEMGKKFAQLRLDYRPRISQQNLADAIGAPRNTIALIEVGKREPSLEMLIKLSKFFGKKPITDIFIGEDIPDFAGSDATLS